MSGEIDGRRFWIALIVAVALVTVVRVIVVESYADTTYFEKYTDFADALRAGTIARDRIPDLSPGYLWFVALWRTLGLGVHALRTFQIVVVSGVALLAAVIAMRIGGPVAAVAAAVLVLTNKAALITACDFEPEALLLFCCAAGLALVMECGGLPPPSEGGAKAPHSKLFAGLAFGLAITLRPVALLAAIALFAWLLWSRRRSVWFATGVVLPVAIFLAINFAMTGSVLLMDPGTVFYEGMNPNATGYAGVPPRIVKAIEPTVPGPDTMHVAYRIVAARAMRHPVTREEANRYWSGKARAFAMTYPLRAIELVARKAKFLVSAHDAYDLPSMASKDREVPGLWISFAVLVPLACFGVAARFSAPVALYSLAAAVSPVVFFVTARHRNPLLIGLAVLGGVAIAEIVRRRAIVAAVVIAIVAVLLSIPGDQQREDDYQWTSTLEVMRLMSRNDRLTAATWMPENFPDVPGAELHSAALRQLTDDPSRMFSIAIALLQSGDPRGADVLLQRLQSSGFHPYRRTRAVSSVAYYRARAAVQLRDAALAHRQLARARDEAPGDADVLALSAFVDRDVRYANELDLLHDPFTRDWSLARAAHAAGAEENARRLAMRAARGCPEWPLPNDLR